MQLRTLFGLALALALFAAPVAVRAESAGAQIGSVNPGKVFDGLMEKKVIQDKMTNEREKIKREAEQRKAEIEGINKQLGELKPESQQYQDKRKQVVEKTIDFRVWVEVKEQDLARMEKDQVRGLFDKIEKATGEIAKKKGLDIVLTERRPEIPANLDQLTPDQLRAIIMQRDFMYSNGRVDVTQEVVAQLNKEFVDSGNAPK